MKKNLLLTSFLIIQYSLQAQTQLSNASFENWEPYLTLAEKPVAWSAGNVSIDQTTPTTTITQSVNKVTDAHEGAYAVRIINFEVEGQSGTELRYGMMNYQQDDGTIQPFSGTPDILTGYYKFEQGDQKDSMTIYISVMGSNGELDVIAYGELAVKTPQSIYTQFEVPLMYLQQNADPAGIYVTFVFNEDASVNSSFTVDALNFEYIITGNQAQSSVAAVSFFPNPAVDEIRFSEEVKSVTITTLEGRVLASYPEETTSLSLTDMQPGLYHITYEANGQTVNSKLVVR